MIRAAAALGLIGALLLLSSWALAESGVVPPTYALQEGQSIVVAVAGATAAYALEGAIAQADAAGGQVTIHALSPGRTIVVVVSAGGTQNLIVVVAPPPERSHPHAADGGDATSASGSYFGSYDSTAGQLSNGFTFAMRQGDRLRRLQFVAATYVTPNGGAHGTIFPLLSYEVAGPGYAVTYLDEAVTTSPLTFQNALMRGIHVRKGLWTFHAGASTLAQFDNFFVPTNPQWTVGLTRDVPIARTGTLSANLYDIINARGVQSSTDGGLLGSLMYAYHPNAHLSASAEVGLSHAVGFAAAVNYDDARQHLDASILEKPYDFASLAVDAQQGFFGTFDYARALSRKLSLTTAVAQSDYALPNFRENTQTAQSTLTDRLNRAFTVNAGVLYSDFTALAPTGFSARTLAVPLALTYNGGHLTLGAQWQPTTDLAGRFANGYGGSVGINQGRLGATAYYSHNVDIPTVATIFSSVPGLQAALEAAGINVSDPAQLAQLLGNAALLAKLGFGGLRLDLSPSQDTAGVNLSWTMRRAARLNASYLQSDSALTQGALAFRIASLDYTARFGDADEGTIGLTYLRTTQTLGAGTTTASAPGVSLTFRHAFDSVPDLLFPTRRGAIGGYVFRDDRASGVYTPSKVGLPGVAVTLDGGRTAVTDARGYYRFANVPYGPHTLAAHVQGTRPFAFTTGSPTVAQAGSTVNFGVSYTQGKLFGYVTDDAGTGVPGVLVQVVGTKASATTRDNGRFTIAGIAPGTYVVAASPDSLPPGYDLSTLHPVTAVVRSNAPHPIEIDVTALRSIAGTVRYYDPRSRTIRPAPGLVVSVPELGRSVTTGADGAYALRELPAGTFTVLVRGGGGKERRTVTLPPAPTTLTGIDFRVPLGQATRAQAEHGAARTYPKGGATN